MSAQKRRTVRMALREKRATIAAGGRGVMPREPKGQEELYLLWLEERWDAHKLDIHYGNGEREDKRTEDVLDMLKGIGELSKRGVESPKPPPWEAS